MLNHELKLNSKIFSEDCEKRSCRLGFGNGLSIAANENEKIVGLTADLAESTKINIFAEKFPDRFFEVGVAEQNLASVASGMAAMGKIPFISSFSIFSPGRNWEQIRTTISYNNQPVKIIGTHCGLSAGPDGGSHQALEDIALTRVLPNLVVISPCDYIEAKKATIACSLNKLPTYIRLDRNNSPLITTEETPFEIGKAHIFFMPDKAIADVGIIATGPILYKALLAAKHLERQGYKIKVMNLSTIKPLDKNAILNLVKETKAIVTVEEHQIAGGMGSAVSEFLSENFPVPIEFVGVNDKFGQSGTQEELQRFYHLDVIDIIRATERILKRKIN